MIRVASPGIIGLIIAILLSFMFVTPAGAQTASVRLEGIVWDPTGEPLSGATLTAVDEETGRQTETISDSEGYYRFLVLPPGVYTVTAKAAGFKDVVHRNKHLYLPEVAVENFSFEVSAIEKEVSPGEVPKLNDSDTSGAFSKRELDAAPLMSRNVFSLSIYQPGIQINAGREGESSVNGARKTMNRITMDGIVISDPANSTMGSSLLTTNPDSISAVQMISTGAKAEYGEAGGGQYILSSRSGSKAWSGEVYDYFRSRVLNANEFFTNTLNVPRPGLSGNIFGITLSGPVGSKTRIFGNYEGNRTDQQLIRNRLVPTASAKAGIFKWHTPDDVYRNDETLRTFDIAANDPRGLGIDPYVATLLDKLPEYNNDLVGDGLNFRGFRFDAPVDTKQHRVDVRVDHSLKPNHQLFLRFDLGKSDSTDIMNNAESTYPAEIPGTYQSSTWALTFGSDWILSPRKVNELRIAYLHPKFEQKRPARLAAPMLLANSWSNPLDPSFPLTQKPAVFQIMDHMSQSMNRHSLKYGISYRRASQNIVDYKGVYPNVTFTSDRDNDRNVPDSSIGPDEQSEISEADRYRFENLYNDLLGRIESVSQTFYSTPTSLLGEGAPRKRDFVTHGFSAFIQDDWKIRRNLTLNLGLRYEVHTSPREKHGLQTVLDKASAISSTAEISDFSIASRDHWYSTDWKSFAPRVGFAWDINGSGNTVLRGAYGVYYSPINGAITDFTDKYSPSLSQTITVYPNTNGGDLRFSDGVPVLSPSPRAATPSATRSASVAVLNPNLKTPRVDQYNIMLEKKMMGLLFEIGYTGTRGKDLFQYANLNQTKTRGDFLQAFQELKDYRDNGTPVPATNTLARIFGSPMAAFYLLKGANFDRGEPGVAADELDLNHYGNYAAAGVSDFYIRNFPQFDKFFYGSNTAESWYDSLQLGIRKTTSHLNFRIYYTWSKSLDTVSSDGVAQMTIGDSFHPENNKAPSDFDRKHTLNAAWNYAIPFGRQRDTDSEAPKWVGGIFGGWNFGALMVWQSGQRFTVTSGRQSLFADVYSTANLDENKGSRKMGAFYHNAGNIYWFNPDQINYFTHPDTGEVGSSGRNSFIGPRYFNMDTVLHKKFYLSETRYLQLRIEAFNVFNNTHFDIPNTDINNTRFGIITSTIGSPRSLQVAMRLKF